MEKLLTSNRQLRQLLGACLNLTKNRQMAQLITRRLPYILAVQEERPKGFEKFWDKGKAPEKSRDKEKKEQEKEAESDKEGDKKEEKHKEKAKGTEKEDFEEFGRFLPPRPQVPLFAIFLIGWITYIMWKGTNKKTLSKQDLLDMLKARAISRMESCRTQSGLVEITAYSKTQFPIGSYRTFDLEAFLKEVEKVQLEAGVPPPDVVKVVNRPKPEGGNRFTILMIAGLTLLIIRAIARKGNIQDLTKGSSGTKSANPMDKKKTGGLGGPRDFLDSFFGFGASKAIEYGDLNKVEVTFKDVAGMEGPKEEIQEFVEFLKNPQKFRKLGAKIPKGALLAGPPGTGKTLLAKACAGEAGVPFFATSGSEFVEMFVGVGAARVRDLFKKAKAKSPAIIFIDEIDAIGKHRAKIGYNDERESTLNQIFVELDGFGTDTNIVVFAATNRKDSLDRALIRPGRFDRIVEVNLPSLKEREHIFGVHLRGLTVSKKITKATVANKLAALTMGMSGADLASVCNEAAILAARHNKKEIDMDDFYEAYDRVLTGLKRKLPMTEQNKKVTAFHEAGHAIVGWFLKYSQPVLKISIVPRSKGSLGHTIMMPDEVELYRKEQIEDMICTMYGGRVAEELFLGSITTGARDDFQKATQLAKHYVGVFGMSKEFGNISGLDYSSPFGGERKTLYSGHMAKKFDKLVQELCNQQYERAKALLKEKEPEIRKLAEMLTKKESVELDELTELLGPTPHQESEGINVYMEDLKKKREDQKLKGANVAKDEKPKEEKKE